MGAEILTFELPDCSCSSGAICLIHGINQKRKVQRNALRAIKSGKLPRAEYDAWLMKYHQKPKSLFGKWNQ